MTMKTTKKVMVGAAAAAVVSLGTLGGFAAAEATGGPTTTAPTTTASTTSGSTQTNPPVTGADRAARRALFQKDFADALGVSVDKLKSAEKKVLTDRVDARLDKAVAAGNITQQRADAIRAAVETGDLSKLPPKAQDRIKKVENRLGI
jgi:limonene-1,2-epoxide hydrolase